MIFIIIISFPEKVSNVDIVRVAERLLSSKPSLVGYGDLTKLGDYIKLDQALAKRDLPCT